MLFLESQIVNMRFEAIEQELHHIARHVAAIESGMRKQGYSISVPSPEGVNSRDGATENVKEGEPMLVDKYDKMLQEQSNKISSMRHRLTEILRTPAKLFTKSSEEKDDAPTVETTTKELAPSDDTENR